MSSRLVVALSFTGLVAGALASGCAQGGTVDSGNGGDSTLGAGGATGSGGAGQGGATSAGGTAQGTGGTTSTGAGGAMGTGGATGTGGSVGTGGGGTTTGAGGGGGTTTTTTGAGGAPATDAGAPDAGPVCSEQPCKLVGPQCGCAAGKACVLTNAGARTCNLAGKATWGAECNAGNRCDAGLACLATGATGTCFKFCDKDAECTAPGGLCVVTLVDANQKPIPDAAVCSPNCSPITNAGCPVAGTACSIAQEQAGAQRFFTMCDGAGAGTQGSACTKDADCAATYGCFTNANQQQKCMKWCDASKQQCAGGLTCAPLSDALGNDIVVGNVTYGVCQ